jgi:hypothetical protein
MKRLIALVVVCFLVMISGLVYADDLSNDKAGELITESFKHGGFPMQWGGSFMGSTLKQLDKLEVIKLKSIKVPDYASANCEKTWIAVVHATGVSRTNNGPIIGNSDNKFDREGTFLMCLGFNDKWTIQLNE